VIVLAHVLGLPLEEVLGPLASGMTAAPLLVLALVTSCVRRVRLRR
jgi:hypothetical protein